MQLALTVADPVTQSLADVLVELDEDATVDELAGELLRAVRGAAAGAVTSLAAHARKAYRTALREVRQLRRAAGKVPWQPPGWLRRVNVPLGQVSQTLNRIPRVRSLPVIGVDLHAVQTELLEEADVLGIDPADIQAFVDQVGEPPSDSDNQMLTGTTEQAPVFLVEVRYDASEQGWGLLSSIFSTRSRTCPSVRMVLVSSDRPRRATKTRPSSLIHRQQIRVLDPLRRQPTGRRSRQGQPVEFSDESLGEAGGRGRAEEGVPVADREVEPAGGRDGTNGETARHAGR